MKFPLTPDEAHEFYQYLHMHAIGYDFPGGIKMRPLVGSAPWNNTATALWYAEDSIGYRVTADGLWVGAPREETKYPLWVMDTSHAFKDAYELVERCNGHSLPALRRPRP
jgi:hypothetical protein